MAGLGYSYSVLQRGDVTAVENLSSAAAQYLIVQSTDNTTFRRTNSAGEWAMGVLQDTPSSGEHGTVMCEGISPIRVNTTAHSAFAVGDKVMGSTNGGGLPSTGGAAQYVLGRALSALAANTTGIIMVHLTHQGGGSTGAKGAP